MHREGFLIAFPRETKGISRGRGCIRVKEKREREGETGKDEEVAKGRDERVFTGKEGETKRKGEKGQEERSMEGREGKREKVADRVELCSRGGNKSHLFFLLVFFSLFFFFFFLLHHHPLHRFVREKRALGPRYVQGESLLRPTDSPL